MGWKRHGDRKYYYRSERIGNRVRTHYVGAGETAMKAAEEDVRRRAEEQAEKEELLAEATLLQKSEQPLLALCELTDLLMRGVLIGAGFHRHARSAWRMRR